MLDGVNGSDKLRLDSYDYTTPDTPGREKKLLVRQTGLRWLMLAFGCLFLMGSYFCYDNPAPLKSTLTDKDGDFKFS